MDQESYKLLLDEAEVLDPHRTVLLETQTGPVPVNNSILAAASDNHVSFILVGMKERGKNLRKYFGTTVTRLCKTSAIPLIVVPSDAIFSALETIALASDATGDTDIQVLNPLRTIAKEFDSSIFVVRVIKKPGG